MWLFKQPSTAGRTVLLYITLGALTVIWTGVWYVYLFNNPPETPVTYYWCTGFLLTGLTLVFIGLGAGRLGRSAQQADLPPKGAVVAVVNPQPNGTAPAPVLAPVNVTSSAGASDGLVAVPLPQVIDLHD